MPIDKNISVQLGMIFVKVATVYMNGKMGLKQYAVFRTIFHQKES